MELTNSNRGTGIPTREIASPYPKDMSIAPFSRVLKSASFRFETNVNANQ